MIFSNNILKQSVKAALLGISVSGAAFTTAHAMTGAVAINNFDGGLGDNQLATTDTRLAATCFTGTNGSFANNPVSAGSAWAHAGDFWAFRVTTTGPRDVTITVRAAQDSDFNPGMTLWSTGDSAFDGGTGIVADDPATIAVESPELSTTNMNTPHSFNAVGAIGSSGTAWMGGSLGNMLETLGYANAGNEVAAGAWGEIVKAGIEDVSNTDTYENGITGTTANGYAEMTVASLQPGWYALFVGGTGASTAAGRYTLVVGDTPGQAADDNRSVCIAANVLPDPVTVTTETPAASGGGSGSTAPATLFALPLVALLLRRKRSHIG